MQAGTVVLLLALGTIEVILLNPHMNKVRTEAWQAARRLTVPQMTQICHYVGGLQGPSRPCEESEFRGPNDPTYPHAPAVQGMHTQAHLAFDPVALLMLPDVLAGTVRAA